MLPVVIFMRGIPGSSKTTTARLIKRGYEAAGVITEYCSNDDFPGYYNSEGVYCWTAERCKEAFKFCQQKFARAVNWGVPVIIIDNTNLTRKAFSHYEKYAVESGYNVQIISIEPRLHLLEEYARRNKHNVPLDVIRQMYRSWETLK